MTDSLDCLNQLAESSFRAWEPIDKGENDKSDLSDDSREAFTAGFKAGFVLASCDPASGAIVEIRDMPFSPIGEKP